MSTTTDTTDAARTSSGTSVLSGEASTAMDTLRRGLELSPQLREGLGVTVALAILATAGRVLVPIAVQQGVDRGLSAPGGVDAGFVGSHRDDHRHRPARHRRGLRAHDRAAVPTAETGLATLRVKAFRHVHDLPVLTQNTERRGALVSRVTSDVDQVSQFLVFGGVIAIVSVGQIVLATVVMVFYSWQLALVVWICFLPLFLSLRYFQKRLSAAYGVVRQQVGALLSAISEPVVGAATVRSYAVQERTQDRIDTAVQRHLTASSRAQALTAFSFSLGGISAGLANAGIVVVGVLLGVAGDLSAGTVLAFAFLVTLFVGPVQMGTQVLTDAQNAFAGWRRVIGILDTPADVSDPEGGVELPDVPLPIHFEHVGYAYTAGRPVLSDVELTLEPHTRVAIVGETGSGKTTLAKILTRLMDPDEGRVLIGGIDLRTVAFSSLRTHIVLVPQEGFLFDATLRENLQYGAPGASDDSLLGAITDLGLGGLAGDAAARSRQPGRAAR